MNVYGMFTTMKVGKGAIMLFWLDTSHYLHSQGFRFMYCRTSNIKSHLLLAGSGGERRSKTKMMEDGTVLTLGFYRWPTDPIHYREYIAEKYKKKANL